jgi:hypothetical protein
LAYGRWFGILAEFEFEFACSRQKKIQKTRSEIFIQEQQRKIGGIKETLE